MRLGNIQFFFGSYLSKNGKLAFVVLAQNPVGILIRSDYPAIQNSQINLRDLSDELFLLRAAGDKDIVEVRTEKFRDACRSEGFEPRIQFQSSMRRTAAFALVAKGYCAIPAMYAPSYQYPGTVFLHFTKDYYRFNITLLYRKGNHSPAVKSFIQCAKDNRQIFSDMNYVGASTESP